ncbi:hypothetical protein HDU97_000858 [Phlyctochytrium planicorne]|nr:hypothetical protein HDU97_000858 [Phlyctochytrium planicorne]
MVAFEAQAPPVAAEMSENAPSSSHPSKPTKRQRPKTPVVMVGPLNVHKAKGASSTTPTTLSVPLMMPAYSSSNERICMLVDATTVKDIGFIFSEMHDLLPKDMMSLMGKNDAVMATEGSVIKSLGEITKAAVTEVVSVADETSLRKPGHFIVQCLKGTTSLHFIAGTSVAYSRWITSVLSLLKKGTEARKKDIPRSSPVPNNVNPDPPHWTVVKSKETSGTSTNTIYNVEGVIRDATTGRWIASNNGTPLASPAPRKISKKPSKDIQKSDSIKLTSTDEPSTPNDFSDRTPPLVSTPPESIERTPPLANLVAPSPYPHPFYIHGSPIPPPPPGMFPYEMYRPGNDQPILHPSAWNHIMMMPNPNIPPNQTPTLVYHPIPSPLPTPQSEATLAVSEPQSTSLAPPKTKRESASSSSQQASSLFRTVSLASHFSGGSEGVSGATATTASMSPSAYPGLSYYFPAPTVPAPTPTSYPASVLLPASPPHQSLVAKDAGEVMTSEAVVEKSPVVEAAVDVAVHSAPAPPPSSPRLEAAVIEAAVDEKVEEVVAVERTLKSAESAVTVKETTDAIETERVVEQPAVKAVEKTTEASEASSEKQADALIAGTSSAVKLDPNPATPPTSTTPTPPESPFQKFSSFWSSKRRSHIPIASPPLTPKTVTATALSLERPRKAPTAPQFLDNRSASMPPSSSPTGNDPAEKLGDVKKMDDSGEVFAVVPSSPPPAAPPSPPKLSRYLGRRWATVDKDAGGAVNAAAANAAAANAAGAASASAVAPAAGFRSMSLTGKSGKFGGKSMLRTFSRMVGGKSADQADGKEVKAGEGKEVAKSVEIEVKDVVKPAEIDEEVKVVEQVKEVDVVAVKALEPTAVAGIESVGAAVKEAVVDMVDSMITKEEKPEVDCTEVAVVQVKDAAAATVEVSEGAKRPESEGSRSLPSLPSDSSLGRSKASGVIEAVAAAVELSQDLTQEPVVRDAELVVEAVKGAADVEVAGVGTIVDSSTRAKVMDAVNDGDGDAATETKDSDLKVSDQIQESGAEGNDTKPYWSKFYLPSSPPTISTGMTSPPRIQSPPLRRKNRTSKIASPVPAVPDSPVSTRSPTSPRPPPRIETSRFVGSPTSPPVENVEAPPAVEEENTEVIQMVEVEVEEDAKMAKSKTLPDLPLLSLSKKKSGVTFAEPGVLERKEEVQSRTVEEAPVSSSPIAPVAMKRGFTFSSLFSGFQSSSTASASHAQMAPTTPPRSILVVSDEEPPRKSLQLETSPVQVVTVVESSTSVAKTAAKEPVSQIGSPSLKANVSPRNPFSRLRAAMSRSNSG